MANRQADTQIRKLLLIESDAKEAVRLAGMLSHGEPYSYTLTHVTCLADAEACQISHSADLILLDLDYPDAMCAEVVMRCHSIARRASIVLLSTPENEPIAIKAMDSGVQDYLIKGQTAPRELMRVISNSIARKDLEETLFNEKSRAQIALNSIGDGVICTDEAGNITFLNPAAERLIGYSATEVTGKPLGKSFRIMDASTGKLASNPTTNTIEPGRTTHLPMDCILTRRDGHQIFIEDSVAPLFSAEGIAAGSVLVFRDVSMARALTEKIAHLAVHDMLTGLPNRLLLNDRLVQAIARARRSPSMIAVLFLDLNNFKLINDSLGHPIGDRLLVSVSKRLLSCVRNEDTVTRQGGDEFVAILQDIQHAQYAATIAQRMLRAVALSHFIDGHELNITISIGISLYPDDGLDPNTLIMHADTAMFQAKVSKREGFRFFRPEMSALAVERQSMEEDLRCALDRHEFMLHYQPIIDLSSGTIIGSEALLRWRHPTRGQVGPMQFIPVAEDCGLILPIGTWVLREACVQAKAWVDAGMSPITIAVNVSAKQFRNEKFLDCLAETLDESGLSPELLVIEVTESVLMEYSRLGVSILKKLRDQGVQVAVDDFGMGYSNLSYLQKYPLDVLKIDQSFVRQIASGPNGKSIVRAIISLGQSLQMRVIAEGVETAEDLKYLRAQNCDEVQGFYFSHAVPAAEFVDLCRKSVCFERPVEDSVRPSSI